MYIASSKPEEGWENSKHAKKLCEYPAILTSSPVLAPSLCCHAPLSDRRGGPELDYLDLSQYILLALVANHKAGSSRLSAHGAGIYSFIYCVCGYNVQDFFSPVNHLESCHLDRHDEKTKKKCRSADNSTTSG